MEHPFYAAACCAKSLTKTDMRIVNRETFLKMPPNTLYSKFEPCVFGELEIKGSTWNNDYTVQDIVGAIESSDSGDYSDKLFAAMETGGSLKMDLDCMGRDGMFDEDQMFAVWEREDIEQLIERLNGCLH